MNVEEARRKALGRRGTTEKKVFLAYFGLKENERDCKTKTERKKKKNPLIKFLRS